MSDMGIVTADYVDHAPGDREIVDWDRPDGKTHRNVPIVYLRRVTEEDYLQQKPHMRGKIEPERCFFWEVSVD